MARSRPASPWRACPGWPSPPSRLGDGRLRHASDRSSSAPTEAAGVASIATALGARPTALVALAGFALAIVLVAGLGRLGGLAAVGLALYLLLPPMLLLAPRHDPAALEAAGRRAWSGFLGLRFLVGPWITLLLLRHWGVLVEVGGAELIVALSAGAAGLAGWNIVATRVTTRRRRIRPDAERPVPPLTIVVTSRDDGDRLLACVEALLEQTYADTWILVVDQGSTTRIHVSA